MKADLIGRAPAAPLKAGSWAAFGSVLAAAAIGPASTAEGQTTNRGAARGADLGYIHLAPTLIAENMEPVIPHPDQEKEARAKLAALEKQFGKKPNILIFLTDDVGWGDFGPYGGGVAVGNPTPNIDRAAAGGLLLTSCYAQPTCSPTRATIMTGQLPIHHGIQRPPMYGEKGGLDGSATLAKILSGAGYVTQAVGKWHMGENEQSQPQNVGFDDFRGFLSVSDMYTEWRDQYFNPEVVYNPARTALLEKMPFNHNEVHAVKGGKIEDLRVIDLKAIQDLDDDWASYSEAFIRRMAKSDKPFFLYHCTRGAHFDNYPSEKWRGKSPGRTSYTDTIVELDDILGRLVRALEETGQAENTLVFITSDNGPEQEIPPHGRTPFRGGKGDTFEGGMRVPGIVYWPGTVKGDRKSDGLFDLADLYNTSIALAGARDTMPKDRYIDGIDQSSFLLADNGQSNRRSIFYWFGGNYSGVRIDEFKSLTAASLRLGLDKGNIGGLSGVTSKMSAGWTFNLYTDPQEQDNITIRHIWCVPALIAEGDRYDQVLKKYPPGKLEIGF